MLNVIEHRAFSNCFFKSINKPEFLTMRSYCSTIKNFRNTAFAHSKGDLSIDTVEYLILSMVHLSEYLNSKRFSNKVKYLKSEALAKIIIFSNFKLICLIKRSYKKRERRPIDLRLDYCMQYHVYKERLYSPVR